MTASTAGREGVPIAMWPALLDLVRRWAVAEFRVEGEPVSWERAGRNTETGASYTPTKTRKAKKVVVDAFEAARPGWSPDATTSFGLLVKFRSATLIRADVDNKVKLIMDALNRVCWHDDSQVDELLIRIDRGADDPHTFIVIYPVEGSRHRQARRRTVRQTLTVTPMIERRVFNIIVGLAAAGRNPALGDIAAAAGLRTAAQARDVVTSLEAGGYVTYDRHQFTIHKPYEGRSTA